MPIETSFRLPLLRIAFKAYLKDTQLYAASLGERIDASHCLNSSEILIDMHISFFLQFLPPRQRQKTPHTQIFRPLYVTF